MGPNESLIGSVKQAEEGQKLIQNPDKNLVKNIISALGNVKSSFELEDSSLNDRSDLPKNALLSGILEESPDIFERHERTSDSSPQSSAKEIRDEKLAKKEKKRLKKEKKERDREKGERNEEKHKKHKKDKEERKISKEERRKEKEKKREERRSRQASKDLSHDESTRESVSSDQFPDQNQNGEDAKEKNDKENEEDKMEVDEEVKENEKPKSPGPMKAISVPASLRSNREIDETIDMTDPDNINFTKVPIKVEHESDDDDAVELFSDNVPKTIIGQIYSSIIQNLTENPTQNGSDAMDVDFKPKKIPENVQFCRVRFVETGVKREISNLKEITKKDGSQITAFNKVRIGEVVIAKCGSDGKLAEAVVMDPTAERSRSLEEEFAKKNQKYVGYVEGVHKKYHCFVKIKNLSKLEIDALVKKYAKIERRRKDEKAE